MAYTDLAVQTVTADGAQLTTVAGVAGGAGTGYAFSNDGNVYLAITNAGAGTPSVVIETGATKAGYAVADETIVLTATAGAKAIVQAGPYRTDTFNVPSGTNVNKVQVNFTGGDETDVTIAAFK